MELNMFKTALLTTIIMFSGTLVGCSSDDTEQKTTLRQGQEKIAAEAVKSIKTPIDRANVARKLTEQHNKAVEGSAGGQ